MAAKRTAGDGGLSEKVGYYADSDGQRLEYAYWQASPEVPAELLPSGLSRKRVTGSGESRTEALKRLGENWEAFEKGESRRGKTRLPGKPCPRHNSPFRLRLAVAIRTGTGPPDPVIPALPGRVDCDRPSVRRGPLLPEQRHLHHRCRAGAGGLFRLV